MGNKADTADKWKKRKFVQEETVGREKEADQVLQFPFLFPICSLSH